MSIINFRNYSDLSRDIAKNVQKIPYCDIVVGIPKSGIIPATIIASFMNLDYIDLDSFMFTYARRKGRRKLGVNSSEEKQKVLIVDDSINTGAEFRRVDKMLNDYREDFEFSFCAIYGLHKTNRNAPAHISLEKLAQPRCFQWNYRNHIIAETACFDMDGVLCVDPTNEQNDDGELYLNFLENAQPLFIPQKRISAIVTSRLEKYREPTINWLKKHKVKYKDLIMLDLPSAEERRRLKAHAPFKAEVYASRDDILFIESSTKQSKLIANYTGKPVISTFDDQMYIKGEFEVDNEVSSSEFYRLRAENQILKNNYDRSVNFLLNSSFEIPDWVDSYQPEKKTDNRNITSFQKAKFSQKLMKKKASTDYRDWKSQKDMPSNLKLFLVSTFFDVVNGAGAAASSSRLRDALKLNGHYVKTASLDDFTRSGAEVSDQPISGTSIPFWLSVSSNDISKQVVEFINEFKPDCVILGAVDRGILTTSDIARIKAPIVWIARDNWLHTGGCLFKLEPEAIKTHPARMEKYLDGLTCTSFMNGCTNCSIFKDPRESAKAEIGYGLKKLLFDYRKDIVLCGISDWMTNMLNNAPLTANHEKYTITNPITSRRPSATDLRSSLLGNNGKKLILLTVHNSNNLRKGFSLMADALAEFSMSIENPEEIVVAVMGANKQSDIAKLKLPFEIKPLGFISCEQDKTDIYNAADLCVVPTLQESLSVVASDSVRNGVPVVAFRTSGLNFFIQHKVNGYLADCFDHSDLANGMRWCLYGGALNGISRNAKSIAAEQFDPEIQLSSLLLAINKARKKYKTLETENTYFWDTSNLMENIGKDTKFRHMYTRYLKKLTGM